MRRLHQLAGNLGGGRIKNRLPVFVDTLPRLAIPKHGASLGIPIPHTRAVCRIFAISDQTLIQQVNPFQVKQPPKQNNTVTLIGCNLP